MSLLAMAQILWKVPVRLKGCSYSAGEAPFLAALLAEMERRITLSACRRLLLAAPDESWRVEVAGSPGSWRNSPLRWPRRYSLEGAPGLLLLLLPTRLSRLV